MNWKLTAIGVCALVSLQGCQTYADKASVQAKAGAPEPARVETFRIETDSSLPRYVLAVEPVQFATNLTEWFDEDSQRATSTSSTKHHDDARTDYGRTVDSTGTLPKQDSGSAPTGGAAPQLRTAGHSDSAPNQATETTVDRGTTLQHTQGTHSSTRDSKYTRDRYQAQKDTRIDVRSYEIAAQLVSALSSIGNFSVRDIRSVRSKGAGRYDAPVRQGEVGPFVIKAMITEVASRVVDESEEVNVFPFTRSSNELQEGMVGLDVSVLDGRTGEIVAAFPVQGTYSSRNDTFKAGVLVPLYERKQFIQSVVYQAQRVALNEAAKKIFAALSDKVRS